MGDERNRASARAARYTHFKRPCSSAQSARSSAMKRLWLSTSACSCRTSLEREREEGRVVDAVSDVLALAHRMFVARSANNANATAELAAELAAVS